MSSLHQYDEAKTLQLLSTGSEYGFTQIFDHYRNRIYGTALKYLKSPISAEEIVQDVFLKIWMKRFDLAHVVRFDNYLFAIARNLIFDRLKKLSYETEKQKEFYDFYFDSLTVSNTDHLAREHQFQQILHKAISQLSSQQREVYILSRQDGLSRDEIARRMNISPLTVKTHLARAIESIKEYLSRNFPHLSLLLAIFINT